MARRISMILVGALTIIALLHCSVSATTYFVGDSSNWAIPSSSNAFSDWAANKNFVVGDTLGQHDVAEVMESDYNACNGSKPIARRTVGPANFTLSSSGVHRFICTVSGHCGLGQKLTVNVAGERAPSQSQSQSQSQSPSSSPRSRSAPARGPVTYTVGDKLGWNILAGGASAYETWAASKTFLVGDVLVFNFANARHDVAELSKANYESCNTNSSISVKSNGPVRVTLYRSGERFFICNFPGHCNAGQKLAVKVISDDNTATSAHGVTPCTSTVDDSPTATSATQQLNGATLVAAAGFTAMFLAFAALALFL